MNIHKKRDFMKELVSKGKLQLKRVLPIDSTLFLLQFIKHPQDIGSIAPSSKALAEAMTRFVVIDPKSPKQYLEVGAGTGAFTKAIVNKLGPKDQLDIVEINPKFCERLQEKYADFSNVHIHNGSVLEWKPPYSYDAIVSSLPFNAFSSDFVMTILEQYKKISKPGTMMTFCEYMALPEIRKIFLPSKSRRKFQETLDTTKNFEIKHEVLVDKVFANFPPAFVHHCKL